MSSNVTYSKLRRLGLDNQKREEDRTSNRFRSNSQDLLNENNIKGKYLLDYTTRLDLGLD